jgi:hypothetical protein
VILALLNTIHSGPISPIVILYFSTLHRLDLTVKA